MQNCELFLRFFFADARVKIGHLESEFLKHLVTLDELEPIEVDSVHVWHTRTQAVDLRQEARLRQQNLPPSDIGIEV